MIMGVSSNVGGTENGFVKIVLHVKIFIYADMDTLSAHDIGHVGRLLRHFNRHFHLSKCRIFSLTLIIKENRILCLY